MSRTRRLPVFFGVAGLVVVLSPTLIHCYFVWRCHQTEGLARDLNGQAVFESRFPKQFRFLQNKTKYGLLPVLTEIEIGAGGSISSNDIQAFKENSHVTRIHVENRKLFPGVGESIVDVWELTQVTLESCDVDAAEILAILQEQELKNLGFYDCRITGDLNSALEQASRLSSLQVSGTGWETDALDSLAVANQLREVCIADSDITDSDIPELLESRDALA